MNRSRPRKFYLFSFVYFVNFVFVLSVIVQTLRPSKCDSSIDDNCGGRTQSINVGVSSRALDEEENVMEIGPHPMTFSGPSWDFSEEYSSINDSRIEEDMTIIDSNVRAMEKIGEEYMIMNYVNVIQNNITATDAELSNLIESLEQIYDLNIKSIKLLKNLNTDSANKEHNVLWTKLGMLAKRISVSYEPVSIFLENCADDILDLFFSKSESTAASKFNLSRSRSMRKHALSPAEDDIISSYSLPGILS